MIYVDELQRYKSGRWCHMMTNGEVEELHRFAELIGLKRTWFQDKGTAPHYDLRPNKREMALRHGAVEASRNIIVGLIQLWRNR